MINAAIQMRLTRTSDSMENNQINVHAVTNFTNNTVTYRGCLRIAQEKFGNGDTMLKFVRADTYLHCNHTESVTCLYEY